MKKNTTTRKGGTKKPLPPEAGTQTTKQAEAEGPGPQPGSPPAPKIHYRTGLNVDHHLFKGTVAQCLKADKFGPIKIKPTEHVHYFHTVTSTGAKQEYTAPIAGHVHKVEWGVDEHGNMVAKCGPALKPVKRMVNGIPRTRYEQIRVRNYDGQEGDPEFLNDNHTHQMVYMGSDKLTKNKTDEIRKSNREEIGELRSDAVIVHQDITRLSDSNAFAMEAANPSTRPKSNE